MSSSEGRASMGDDGGNMGGLATWLVASLEGAGPHNGAHTAGMDQTGPTGSSSGAGIRCPGPLGSGQGSGLDHVVTSGSEPGPDGAETSGAAPDCSGWGGWGTGD